MKVKIKEFAIDMDVKTKGVGFEIRDNNDAFLGDVYITKTGLIWCKGKTNRKNGKKIPWEDFVSHMDNRS
ncbi:MAG: hypothetical protein GDA35_06465 [Hyphomonadaceae bacterium]|nr:hypothetical protein [Hyphomonadaceae bacterium]